jgi:hypothetical protein
MGSELIVQVLPYPDLALEASDDEVVVAVMAQITPQILAPGVWVEEWLENLLGEVPAWWPGEAVAELEKTVRLLYTTRVPNVTRQIVPGSSQEVLIVGGNSWGDAPEGYDEACLVGGFWPANTAG